MYHSRLGVCVILERPLNRGIIVFAGLGDGDDPCK
jgi:hypothetical protein